MPSFSRNSLNEAAYSKLLRKYPALFGVPFVLLIVGASFGMQQFTQTRYDLHAQKVTAVRLPLALCSSSGWMRTSDWYGGAWQLSKEQELGLSQNRRKVDVREEYFVSLRCLAGVSLPESLSSCALRRCRNWLRLRTRTGSPNASNDRRVSRSGVYLLLSPQPTRTSLNMSESILLTPQTRSLYRIDLVPQYCCTIVNALTITHTALAWKPHTPLRFCKDTCRRTTYNTRARGRLAGPHTISTTPCSISAPRSRGYLPAGSPSRTVRSSMTVDWSPRPRSPCRSCSVAARTR